MRLCEKEFQSCHFYGELPVVGFVLLELALDEVDFFKGRVCAHLSMIWQVLSLALGITIVS